MSSQVTVTIIVQADREACDNGIHPARQTFEYEAEYLGADFVAATTDAVAEAAMNAVRGIRRTASVGRSDRP